MPDAKGNPTAKDASNKAKAAMNEAGVAQADPKADRAAMIRGAAQKSAMNAAGLDLGDPGFGEDDGGYIYKLNPDKSVTIVYDPTGRATGVTLKEGGGQRKAYEAILQKVYGVAPKSGAKGKASGLKDKVADALEDVPGEITAKAAPTSPRTGAELMKGIAQPALEAALESRQKERARGVVSPSQTVFDDLAGKGLFGQLLQGRNEGIDKLTGGLGASAMVAPVVGPMDAPKFKDTALGRAMDAPRFQDTALGRAMDAPKFSSTRLGQQMLEDAPTEVIPRTSAPDDVPTEVVSRTANAADDVPTEVVARKGAAAADDIPTEVVAKRAASAVDDMADIPTEAMLRKSVDVADATTELSPAVPRGKAAERLSRILSYAKPAAKVLGAIGAADTTNSVLGLPGAMLGQIGYGQSAAARTTPNILREGTALRRIPFEYEELGDTHTKNLKMGPPEEIDRLYNEGVLTHRAYKLLTGG